MPATRSATSSVVLALRIGSVVMLLGLTAGQAYGQRQEHAEFWPEIQLRYGIDDATTATLMSRLRVSADRRGIYLAEQEASVSHDFTGWFAAGGGFHHSNSTNGG